MSWSITTNNTDNYGIWHVSREFIDSTKVVLKERAVSPEIKVKRLKPQPLDAFIDDPFPVKIDPGIPINW